MIQDAELSGCCFYMNLITWGDFKICISVPLNETRNSPFRAIFANTAFFRFLNHILKLKTLGQPQSAGEESLLTRDIEIEST